MVKKIPAPAPKSFSQIEEVKESIEATRKNQEAILKEEQLTKNQQEKTLKTIKLPDDITTITITIDQIAKTENQYSAKVFFEVGFSIILMLIIILHFIKKSK